MKYFKSIAVAALLVTGCATSESVAPGSSPSFADFGGYTQENIEALIAEAAPQFGIERAAVSLKSSPPVIIGLETKTHAEPSLESLTDKIRNIGAESASATTVLATVQGLPNNGGWSRTDDGFFHSYSGLHCPGQQVLFLVEEGEPKKVLEVSLDNIKGYDGQGYDTHCEYKDERGLPLYTLWVSYWPDTSLDESFNAAYAAMTERFTVKEKGELTEVTIETDPNAETSIEGETKTASLIVAVPNIEYDLKTSLWLNKTGDWHVKERATYFNGHLPAEILAAIIHGVALLNVDQHINSIHDFGVSNEITA